MLDCPVCPKKNITENACPQCGTDLEALLRLRELPEVYYRKGVSFAEKGELDTAIENLMTAISLNSEMTPYYLELGNIYTKKGWYDEAAVQYRKGLAIEPENSELIKASMNAEQSENELKAAQLQQTGRLSRFKKLLIVLPVIAFAVGLLTNTLLRNNEREQIPLSAVTTDVPENIMKDEPISETGKKHEILYRVRSGDSLSMIAFSLYGDTKLWHRIYDANRDKIADPDNISEGQVLSIAFNEKNED